MFIFLQAWNCRCAGRLQTSGYTCRIFFNNSLNIKTAANFRNKIRSTILQLKDRRQLPTKKKIWHWTDFRLMYPIKLTLSPPPEFLFKFGFWNRFRIGITVQKSDLMNSKKVEQCIGGRTISPVRRRSLT